MPSSSETRSVARDLYWAIIIASREFGESKGMLNLSNMNCREIGIGWMPPEVGWVKLNVDGDGKDDGTGAGCGGLIRTSSSKWVVGFNMELDVADSLSVEIWSLIIGLNLAWDKGFWCICLETDSKRASELFRNGCTMDNLLAPLIR